MSINVSNLPSSAGRLGVKASGTTIVRGEPGPPGPPGPDAAVVIQEHVESSNPHPNAVSGLDLVAWFGVMSI